MIEHPFVWLDQEQARDIQQRVKQACFLDRDHCLRGERLQQMAVVVAEGANLRALQVQDALETPARSYERHSQLRSHPQIRIKRMVEAYPGRCLKIVDAQRLTVHRDPTHNAGAVDGQGVQLRPAWGTRNRPGDKLMSPLTHQTKDTVVSAGHIQRHLQDSLQRLIQAET